MKRFLIVLALLALAITPAFAQDSGRTPITIDNATNLSELIRLGRGSAEFAQWSPDGAHILVGGSLGIWKYDATAIDTANEPQLIDVDGEVDHFTISPDGSTIAVSHTGNDLLELRDFETGAVIESAEIIDYSQRLAYSADGSLLAMNSGSQGVVVYDGINVFTQVEASLNANVDALISPDGTKLIAVVSYDILVWDLVAGGEPITLEGHAGTINDIAISADGSLLASGSSDDSFIIWDLQAGTALQTVSLAEESYAVRDVYSVAFSPDGTTLLTGHSGIVRIYDVTTATLATEIEVGSSNTEDFSYSPDGSQFFVLTKDQATALQLFNADGTHVATSFYHNADINAITFSPDSAVLAFADNDSFLYTWDTASAGEITTSNRVADAATFGLTNSSNITYSSDNRYLAVLQSFRLELHDPITGALIREFDDTNGIAEDVEFSPDNTLIAFITSQALYVFDVETGTQLAYFDDANDWMRDVTWSPDQTMLATASSDHAIRIYTIP